MANQPRPTTIERIRHAAQNALDAADAMEITEGPLPREDVARRDELPFQQRRLTGTHDANSQFRYLP